MKQQWWTDIEECIGKIFVVPTLKLLCLVQLTSDADRGGL
jgi:hypothetical protein